MYTRIKSTASGAFSRLGHIVFLSVLAAFFLFPSEISAAKNKNRTKQKTMANTFQKPDFAFPKTVDKNASAVLEASLAKGDWINALRADIQLTIAKDLVSSSRNLVGNLGRLDSITDRFPEELKPLPQLLKATILTSVYNDNRWQYDQRTIPKTSLPEDPTEWDAAAFQRSVSRLIRSGMTQIPALDRIPIKDLSPVATNLEFAEKNGFTAADFFFLKALECMESFPASTDGERTIPFFGNKKMQDESASLKSQLIKKWVSIAEPRQNKAALCHALLLKSQDMGGKEKMDFLLDQYRKLKESPFSLPLLDELYGFVRLDRPKYLSPSREREALFAPAEFYGLANEAIVRFKYREETYGLQNQVNDLRRESVQISTDGPVASRTEFEARLESRNIKDGYLLLYRIAGNEERVKTTEAVRKGKLVRAIPYNCDGKIPFVADTTLTFQPLKPGTYALIPSSTPDKRGIPKRLLDKSDETGTFTVSDLAAFTVENSRTEGSGLYVVNGKNGKPVSGAKVLFYEKTWREKKLLEKCRSDRNGYVQTPAKANYAEITDSSSFLKFNFYTYGRDFTVNETLSGTILTDRGIYRPGDKIGFSTVIYRTGKKDINTVPNLEIDVTLRNANYQATDTIHLTTDRFGRANGEFTIPQGGLLGSWSLVCRPKTGGSGADMASAPVRIEEYRNPTFYVELMDIPENQAQSDSVTIRGRVATYSGMPVSGAAVDLKVSFLPWFRWREDPASYGERLESDNEGYFSLTLPVAGLRKTEFVYGTFALDVSATSPAGETQSAPQLRFMLGEQLRIDPRIPAKTDITAKEVKFNVPVYDMLSHPLVRQIDYTATDASGKEVLKGSFDSPLLTIDPAAVVPGELRFKFTVKDGEKAEASTILYNPDSDVPPVKTPLWVPVNEITAEPGADTVRIPVGSSFKAHSILTSVSDSEKTISREWMKTDGKINWITVPAPGRGEKVFLNLVTVNDMKVTRSTVTVLPASSREELETEVITFRDKITPSATETWTFRFKGNGGLVIPEDGIPAMAVMTDKALDALVPFSWSLGTHGFPYISDSFRLSAHLNDRLSANYLLSDYRWLRETDTVYPDWETYGYPFSGRMFRRSMLYKSAGKGAVACESVMDECADAAMPMAAPMEMKTSKSLASMNAADAGASEKESESIESPEVEGSQEKMEFRKVECPLAFFKPDLLSDREGNLEIGFEVPNFNTTWKFQLVGYTPDMHTSYVTLDATASKRVMAQLNAPRFLRTGDRIELAATFYNNSESAAKVGGLIEVLDPVTGEIIASSDFSAKEVTPSGNRLCRLEFTAPDNLNSVIVRATARSGRYSDGEQMSLHILPSSEPVIESTPYYIKPGTGTFSLRLPKFGKRDQVTFSYCDNPVWYCLTALPDLMNPDSKNVLSQMQALYANSMSVTLLKRHPELAGALEKVLASEEKGNGLLVSPLEKNGEEKLVGLDETPWVNDAASDTKRMMNLGSLLDTDNARTAIDSQLEHVLKLRESGSGWSWCPGFAPSTWITSKVLLQFALLDNYGALPESPELRKAIVEAVAFIDDDIVSEFRKHKNFSLSGMLNYLYVRSSFRNGMIAAGSSEFRKLTDRALSELPSEWRRMSIYDKATAATVLFRYGKENVAREILSSLDEFATSTPEKGMWFDNLRSGSYSPWNTLVTTVQVLDAFNAVDRKAPQVDGLRQWLTLLRQNQDWGRFSYTIDIVNAVLSSGTEWTAPERPAEITLGGKVLKPEAFEELTGAFTLNLKSSAASGAELRITKYSAGPSWGGVLSSRIAPVKEVKEAGIDGLSVKKRFYLIETGKEGTSARETDDFRLSQLVRVELTVTNDKDLEYVMISDSRPACLEPEESLSGYTLIDGNGCYRETRNRTTNLFFTFLPKGTHVFSFDCRVSQIGEFANGIATVQSQYNPLETAHSSGGEISVRN